MNFEGYQAYRKPAFRISEAMPAFRISKGMPAFRSGFLQRIFRGFKVFEGDKHKNLVAFIENEEWALCHL